MIKKNWAWQKQKKRTHHKTKTQNPLPLGSSPLLFCCLLMLVLLSSSSSFIPKIICFQMPQLCPQNLKTTLTTTPIKIAIGVITYPFSSEIGARHEPWNPFFLFLESLHYNFFFFCLSFFLFTYLSLSLLSCGANKWAHGNNNSSSSKVATTTTITTHFPKTLRAIYFCLCILLAYKGLVSLDKKR